MSAGVKRSIWCGTGAIALVMWLAGMSPAWAQVTVPNTFSSGTSISSSQMNTNFSTLQTYINSLSVLYTVYSSVGQGLTVTAVPTCAQVNTTVMTFTKQRADTKIEIDVQSIFNGGTFAGGSTGVWFMTRVDGNGGNLVNGLAVIQSSGAASTYHAYQSIWSGLTAASHTVTIVACANGTGSSSNVTMDSGNWGGNVIIKEFH